MDYSFLTEQKIAEKFEDLPQDLKNVLSSINTSITIENIATKYRLNEEKTAMLIQLVGLVILGFVNSGNMKEEMKETIGVSPQFIPLIADEIYQKIFLPVKDSMQKIMAVTPQVVKPAIPILPTSPVPAPAPIPISPAPQPTAPTPRSVDEYREPAFSIPEIVDLRKKPAPIPPAPSLPSKPLTVPPAPAPTAPAQPAAKPMPITPLIAAPEGDEPRPSGREAEPHQMSAPKPIVSAPKPIDSYREPSEPRPQYIMRPSGLPPTDLPENVLDLRKDKGEF